MTIWHVYYGTRGTAGAYIDALQEAMHAAGAPSRAFVSSAYRFDTKGVVRMFFPFTDRFDYQGKGRRLLRGLELGLGYVLILIASLVSRPALNLSLIDDYRATWLFFRLCKWAGLRMYLTCHDVVAHDGSVMSLRLDMMTRADFLIVHSEDARRTLLSLVGPSAARKVLVLPFPWSSYDSILSPEDVRDVGRRWGERLRGRPFVCLLGVVRRSKGVETLLRAWEQLDNRHGHRLVIAGKWDDARPLKSLAESLPDCLVDDRYIGDGEFAYLIRAANWVVLPYHDYTHSSVLMSVLKQGGAPLTSDIPMFQELLGRSEWMFPAGSAEGLRRVLDRAMTVPASEIAAVKNAASRIVQDERGRLVARIREDVLPTLGTTEGRSRYG